jgi:WD40 repeat protein
VLWDAASGKQLRAFAGHTAAVTSVAFSPDCKSLLTGSQDKTAALWDAASGERIRTFQGHTNWVQAVAFSPDGKRVLTGSTDTTAALWDAGSGKQLRLFRGHRIQVNSVAFNPDGRRVLTGASDMAALWDAESGQRLRTFEGSSCASVAFSPDGKRVLTGSYVETTTLWDAESGEQIRTFRGQEAVIKSVAFSPDGKRVLTGSLVKTARLWDAEAGELLRTFPAAGLNSVAFSPDGRRVLTSSSDNTTALWDTESAELLRTFQGRASRVTSAASSPDGRRVLTGSGDKMAVIWDAEPGGCPRVFRGHTAEVTSVAFSPDGKRVLIGSLDQAGAAGLWDTASGQQLRRFRGVGRVVSVAYSPDGRRVLTASFGKPATLWDTESDLPVRSLWGHESGVLSVSFSPDSRRVLTGSEDKTAALWEAQSGERIHTFRGHTLGVQSVTFSPDGRRVLTGSGDKTAALWDAESGERLRTFPGHTSTVLAVAFSADGKRVLTGSDDKTAALWDVESGKQLHTFLGHTSAVGSVSFNPDGKRTLTASADGTTRLWDATTGRELCALMSLDGGADWLVVTPDGLFDGSVNASRYMDYRVAGTNEIVPLASYHKRYYRPGLLASLMAGERVQATVAAAKALPPRVAITSPKPGLRLKDKGVTVEAAAQGASGGPVISLRLLLDGRPYGGADSLKSFSNARPGKVTASWDVELPPGTHRLAVKATCEASDSTSDEVELTYVPPGAATPKGPTANLYVLAIGINAYPGRLRLKGATPDARLIEQTFKDKGRGLFRGVETNLLTDREATQGGIRDGLDWLKSRAKSGDVAVVFYAGHGSGQASTGFYLLPVDVDPRKLEQTAVSGQELRRQLGELPSSTLLLLDACYAGSFDGGKRKRSLPAAADALVREFVYDQGLVVMCGAAKEQEAAEEEGHGFFTRALVDGLTGKAARGRDGLVYLHHLGAYVIDRVKELSDGEQEPTVSNTSLVRSFPLAKP